jgi:hypoxanthine phosphoribosyltransferase
MDREPINRNEMSLKPDDRVRLDSMDARVLFTAGQVQNRVSEIGASLRRRIGGECPVFIALLHGGFVFISDLIRAFREPQEVDFLKVSRYDPKQKDPTAVRIMHDLRSNIRDRAVVVVEGIRAKGTKIEYVDRFLQLHRPGRIEYCAMIRPSGANAVVPVHETGFTIGEEFVVGYGLDYRERYRNLAFISALETAPTGESPAASEGVQ